jgi:hypothetical protein
MSMASRNPSSELPASATTMPIPAMPKRPAVRATALFTPDARPVCSTETASITTVVSGATKSAAPQPSSSAAGKNVVQ